MAKVTLTGKILGAVAEGTTGANGTPFKKFIVAVITGGGNNPRVAGEQKTSYFGVMTFGKLAEAAYQAGQTVVVDGEMEVTEFQVTPSKPANQAVVVSAKRVEIVPGDRRHYAHTYNVLGNLVLEHPDHYAPKTEGAKAVITQKVAVSKYVGEKEYTSFYRIVFFGDRGQKLADKGLLDKGRVKSVLVDGSIRAEYSPDKNDPSKRWLNVDILVDDFQIACWRNVGQKTPGEPEVVIEKAPAAPELPEIDIDEEDIPF